jgi:hypothetical protein
LTVNKGKRIAFAGTGLAVVFWIELFAITVFISPILMIIGLILAIAILDIAATKVKV